MAAGGLATLEACDSRFTSFEHGRARRHPLSLVPHIDAAPSFLLFYKKEVNRSALAFLSWWQQYKYPQPKKKTSTASAARKKKKNTDLPPMDEALVDDAVAALLALADRGLRRYSSDKTGARTMNGAFDVLRDRIKEEKRCTCPKNTSKLINKEERQKHKHKNNNKEQQHRYSCPLHRCDDATCCGPEAASGAQPTAAPSASAANKPTPAAFEMPETNAAAFERLFPKLFSPAFWKKVKYPQLSWDDVASIRTDGNRVLLSVRRPTLQSAVAADDDAAPATTTPLAPDGERAAEAEASAAAAMPASGDGDGDCDDDGGPDAPVPSAAAAAHAHAAPVGTAAAAASVLAAHTTLHDGPRTPQFDPPMLPYDERSNNTPAESVETLCTALGWGCCTLDELEEIMQTTVVIGVDPGASATVLDALRFSSIRRRPQRVSITRRELDFWKKKKALDRRARHVRARQRAARALHPLGSKRARRSSRLAAACYTAVLTMRSAAAVQDLHANGVLADIELHRLRLRKHAVARAVSKLVYGPQRRWRSRSDTRHTVVVLGDRSSQHSRRPFAVRGHPTSMYATPSDALFELAAKTWADRRCRHKVSVVRVAEYATSASCHRCCGKMSVNVMTNAILRGRGYNPHAHHIAVCTSRVCAGDPAATGAPRGRFISRDVNAAANIAHIGFHVLKGLPRDAELRPACRTAL